MAILRCSQCHRRTNDMSGVCENCGRDIDRTFEWIAGQWSARRPPAEFDSSATANSFLDEAMLTDQATRDDANIPMSVGKILFSFDGRISRSEYWLAFAVLLPFGVVNNVLYFASGSPVARAIAMVIGIISFWPGLALLIKRWHDRDRSAWWLTTLLIPFLGFVALAWLIIEIWFLKGTHGNNRFGADPLRRASAISESPM